MAMASFPTVDQILFSQLWQTEGYDQKLRIALREALSMIHGAGIVGHVARRQITISHFLHSFRDRAEPLTQVVRAAVGREIQKADPCDIDKVFPFDDLRSQGLAGVFVTTPEQDPRDPQQSLPREPTAGENNYCALLYDPDGRWRIRSRTEHNARSDEEEEFRNHHALKTLRVILGVIRRRERRFAPFPPEVSQRYWNDSEYFLRQSRTPSYGEGTPLCPPWEQHERSHRTVTLSFDLRKSTFCMLMADDHRAFAHWLDELVKILSDVTHYHGGVFDKFTGDGCLVHFLQREYDEVYGQRGEADRTNVVQAALNCAVDMQHAIGRHLMFLRPILRMDSALLGAGIALGYSDAYWSHDYQDNPIVVGPGVVDACRLCECAEAESIIFANNAYHALPEQMKDLAEAERLEVQTKEHDSKIHVLAWKISPRAMEHYLGTPSASAAKTRIERLCERVYSGR